MSVVVDANILVVLASGDPRAPKAQALVRRWVDAGDEMHAPELLRFEVANGLTRLLTAGAFPADRIADAWRAMQRLPIRYHPLASDGPEVIALALRLGRQSAYDAAYLLLAQKLDAELWTFDGPLARNALGLGLAVRLVD